MKSVAFFVHADLFHIAFFVPCPLAMGKYGRFSPFMRGRIVGKAEEGAAHSNIRNACLKRDGKKGSLRAIRAIAAHAREDPAERL